MMARLFTRNVRAGLLDCIKRRKDSILRVCQCEDGFVHCLPLKCSGEDWHGHVVREVLELPHCLNDCELLFVVGRCHRRQAIDCE